jgi:phosphoglycerate kinase
MNSVRDIGDINGKKVFLRADFNVPVKDGIIIDDFRIKKATGIIDFLREKGAKIVIGSHFEGEGGSLKPVFEYLKKLYPVVFIDDFYPNTPDINTEDIVLLENLRKYPEEKSNDDTYAKHLASFADYYVNEAFSSSHREHASIVGIPKYLPSFAGFVFEEEIAGLSQALHPENPFVFVLGGAKFETKIPLVKKFFALADKIFIGGALANDFLKASGFKTGTSLLSKDDVNIKDFLTDKLTLPSDVLVKNNSGVSVKDINDIEAEDYIVDVGPKSVEKIRGLISDARFILWNGPLGNYELGYKNGTLELASCIARSSAKSIVGGGDTIASIAELNLYDKFTFISTGGGAMLDFLANETLPGIEALNKSI